MHNVEWRLIIPLFVLYIVGILGFWAPNFVPAIAALAKNGVNQEWLGFIGNLIAGGFTLVAAGIAWFSVQAQINTQRRLAEDARAKKEFAARAVLPLSLSALHNYASNCIAALDQLPKPVPIGTIFVAPKLPINDVQEIRDALESMSDAPAQQLAETLQFLQIQHARLMGLEDEARDGTLISYVIQRRTIDALDLNAQINRSYAYARGKNYQAPRGTSVELRSAFDIHHLYDIDYPLILEEIDRREEGESKGPFSVFPSGPTS